MRSIKSLLCALFMLVLSVPSMQVTATSDEPRIGEILSVRGPAWSGTRSRKGRDNFRQQYAAPPGWYILDVQVHTHRATGDHSYGHSTIPGNNSTILEIREIEEKYSSLIDYAETKGDQTYAQKLREELESLKRTRLQIQSSHNIVVLSGWIEPTFDDFGFRTARGHVNLTTTVKIVRFLTPDEFVQRINSHRQALQMH